MTFMMFGIRNTMEEVGFQTRKEFVHLMGKIKLSYGRPVTQKIHSLEVNPVRNK